MTKVVFFGTSDRSTPILETLKQNFGLILCITKEDVLVGRHKTPKEVEVKTWAKNNGVSYITINESFKKDADDIIEQIKSSEAELGVVADFGFIIPQEIIDVFPRGLINIHFSLLPKYRGSSPVQFAILNRDQETGISYQLLDKGLDTGPLINQVRYKLNEEETSGELYKTLFEIAAQKLPDVVEGYLSGKLPPKPQDESKASYTHSPIHPKSTFIYKEDGKINWTKSVASIDAAVRAFNPWPVAWTTLAEAENSKEKITGFTRIKDPKNGPKTLKIYAAKVDRDRLTIESIKMEGDNLLTWEQFKNGHLTVL